MRAVSRRAFTLHEMIISLSITGVVVALASSAALGQLRFFRGVGEVVALRAQLGHATAVSANVLRAVANAGDIASAVDSAFEAEATTGVAFACATDTGRVLVPAASPNRGNTLGAYAEKPQPGDAAHVTGADTGAVSWMTLHVATAPSPGSVCAAFPHVGETWNIALREPLVVSSGAAVRFTRRMRLSLYRSSDDRWYLGLKDWNGETNRFNTIQPVAGPLRDYSADPARTGLLFEYRDRSGLLLPSPVDLSRIAIVTVIARGETIRPVRTAGLHSPATPLYGDSLAIAVAVRNSP